MEWNAGRGKKSLNYKLGGLKALITRRDGMVEARATVAVGLKRYAARAHTHTQTPHTKSYYCNTRGLPQIDL